MALKTLSDFINDQVQFLTSAFPQINVSPGTVMGAILSLFANTNYQLQTALNSASNDGFISTASGQALDALAFDFGIQRIQPIQATGNITLTRTNTVLPLNGAAGQHFSTINSDLTKITTFTSTAPFSFAAGQAQITVPISCDIAGSLGNVGVGTITNISVPIQGVTSVFNSSSLTGGTDRESDDSLRNRILLSLAPQNTVSAVKNAVLAIPGIATAAVFDQQDHNGNFLVYAADTTGILSPANQTVVLNATNNTKSLGSTATILAPVVTTANIVYNFAVQPNYVTANVQQAINTAINQYFNNLTIGKVFRVFDLQAYIIGNSSQNLFVPGLLDFQIASCSIANPYVPLPWEVVKLGTLSGNVLVEPN